MLKDSAQTYNIQNIYIKFVLVKGIKSINISTEGHVFLSLGVKVIKNLNNP